MANRIKGITVEIGGDTTGLDKALKGVNSTIKDTQSQLKDVERLLKLDPTNTELLNQKQKLLKDSISATKEKLDALNKAQEQAKKQLENGDLGQDKYDALQREIIETEQQLKKLETEAKNSRTALVKIGDAGEKIKSVGEKIKSVGDDLTKKVTVPIVGVGVAAVAAFGEVDGAMDTLITKTGATGDELDKMQKSVENIATSMPTDFQTAANAVGEVATRFDDVGDNLEDLSEKFVKFAALNNVDVVSAIDNVQASMAAFGVPTEKAGLVLDTLNSIGQQTGVSVDQLSASLTQNAGVMKELGFSYEESAAFLANLNKNGVDASSVMTGLKTAWKNATKDGKDLDTALKEINDSIVNAKTDQEAYTAATELFGAKAGPAMAQAIRDGRLSLDDLGVAMTEYAGNLEETFDATVDPLDQNKQIMNELKLVGSDIASTMQEMLVPVLEKVQEVLHTLRDKWNGLTEKQQQNIIKVVAVVAALGPLLSILGSIITVIGSVIAIIGSPLLGPIAIVVGVIAGLIAIGVLLYKNWDTIKEKAKQLGEKISEVWENIKSWTEDKWNGIKDTMTKTFDNAKTAVTTKATEIKDKVTTTFDKMGDNARESWDALKWLAGDTWTGIKDVISGNIDDSDSYVLEKCLSIKDNMKEKFNDAKDSVLDIFDSIKESIRDKMDAAKDAVSNAIDRIKSIFDFDWHFPPLKLPHFSIVGEFSLNPPSVPHLSIDWYAKAMQNGMILNSPTIFGMQGGKLLAGGEAGSETVVGTESLMRMIANAVEKSNNSTVNYGDMNVYVNSYGTDAAAIADEIGAALNKKLRMAGSW